jgi:hypothetical protein
MGAPQCRGDHRKIQEGSACRVRSGFRKLANPALTSRALLAKRQAKSTVLGISPLFGAGVLRGRFFDLSGLLPAIQT